VQTFPRWLYFPISESILAAHIQRFALHSKHTIFITTADIVQSLPPAARTGTQQQHNLGTQ
jgi:hypothetical protein